MIDERDDELVAAATRLIQLRYVPVRHHVGAALLAASGATYLGLHVGCGRMNLCAEQTALANGITAGEDRFVTCVAMTSAGLTGGAQVVSPCGSCRELLAYYAPNLTVLVHDGRRVLKTYIADLLPAPWLPTANASIRNLLSIEEPP